MYSEIKTGAIWGVSAYMVSVEVDIASGLPAFSMVGSLGKEVRESRERVCVALKNAGLSIPAAHITVNLSPADQKKEGTAFDLPIAVGILQCMEYFTAGTTEEILFLGELGLNGEIKTVRGVLPIVREAALRGMKECIVPSENALEGAVIPGIRVRGATHIVEVLEYLRHKSLALANGKDAKAEGQFAEAILPVTDISKSAMKEWSKKELRSELPDFAGIRGQESAKRAAEIAAAGFHNLLMTGPPGVGKSMIAKCIPGILPSLTEEERLEVTAVYSVAGLLAGNKPLLCERPFQSPHHTISQVALTGGSVVPKPGVISLSHRGVLFLDELPEFQRNALDSLRQPLEERQVHIARVGGNIIYPADFMLVCAMNPCPCGYYPDRNRCKCSEVAIRRYMGRVSGPILDRMDLCVELLPVSIGCLQEKSKEESSDEIRARIIRARHRQEIRFAGSGYRFNADMSASDVERFCVLGQEERKYVEEIFKRLHLSARAYHRMLKVARTIADLSGEENITTEHLLEAACYRPATEYWN